MPINGMILAAGLGTRMQHLTADKPKPLIPVRGKPMIDHIIEKLQSEGAENIVVNTHYKAEMLEQHLNGFDGVQCIREETLLGQGGGIKNALHLLGDQPFFTVNSDALWTGNALKTLAETWREGMQALLLLIPTPIIPTGTERSLDNAPIDKQKPGDFYLDDGKLGWRGDKETAPYLYTGIQMLHPDIIRQQQETVFSLQKIYNDLIDNDKLYGIVHKGEWFHMGTVQELASMSKI